MQTIQLRPSLMALVPLGPTPGANRDNSASPQCFSAPCYKRPVPGRSVKKGGSPAPAGSAGLAQVPPGQQEPSFPWKLSPHQRGAGTAGGKPVACRESLPWRAVDGAGLRSQVVGMVCTMAASARAGPFPVGGYAPLAASASPASAPPALPSAVPPLPAVPAELVPPSARLSGITIEGAHRGGCCPRRRHGLTRQHRTIPDLGQAGCVTVTLSFSQKRERCSGGHGMRWEAFSSFSLRSRGDRAGISCAVCSGAFPEIFSYLSLSYQNRFCQADF